jgi:hypothetical protein
MSLKHGRNVKIYMNGVDLSGDINEVSPTSEQDMGDITVAGDIGHTLYPGMANDKLTIQALYNNTEYTLVESMVGDPDGLGMLIAFGNQLGVSAYGANEVMYMSNSMKTVVTDVNRATLNFDIDNYPFEPCLLLSSGAQPVGAASSADGSTVDLLVAAATTGGAAYLQVLALSAGTLTVKVETSATGAFAGEEATSATFAAASSAEAQRVGITGTFGRYTRATWAASAGTATFVLALNKK